MKTIFDLMNALSGAQPQLAPTESKWYVKYNALTMDILGLSHTEVATDEIHSLEIPNDTALAILSGDEDMSRWTIGYVDDVLSFVKTASMQYVPVTRTELSTLIELKPQTKEQLQTVRSDELEVMRIRRARSATIAAHTKSRMEHPSFMPKDYWPAFDSYKTAANHNAPASLADAFDVLVTLDRKNAAVEIAYDRSAISSDITCRLFFTREDDPSFLKGMFRLNESRLVELMRQNNLSAIPNPVKFRLPFDTDDLSIYTVKNSLRVAVVEAQ